MRAIVVILLFLCSGYAYGQYTCSGFTKSGNPCKKKVSEAYTFCSTHNPGNAPKDHCYHVLASGKYCGNSSKANSIYCGIHQSGYAKQPNGSSGGGSGAVSGQCAGTTKAGERCKRMTTTVYCYQHGN